MKIIDEGAGALAKVDWAALAARVAESSEHDGYPAGSSEVVVMASSGSTSTERAALAGLPEPETRCRACAGRRLVIDVDGNLISCPACRGVGIARDDWTRHEVRDDVAKAHEELCALMVEAAAVLGACLRKLAYIQHVRDQKPDREWELAGICRGCGRVVEGNSADPFRLGYCGGCYKGWTRAGCPANEARVAFDRQRWLAAHPTCTAEDEHDWRRRQHTDERGQVLPVVIPLDGQDEYRRHAIPPAIDPDDVMEQTCESCGGSGGEHYSWCSART